MNFARTQKAAWASGKYANRRPKGQGKVRNSQGLHVDREELMGVAGEGVERDDILDDDSDESDDDNMGGDGDEQC